MQLNGIALLFLVINALALLFLPRRWAPMPLLIGACYMTLNSGIEIGPAHFSIIRILIAAGLLRVIVRRERMAGEINSLDQLMLVWAIWAILSSVFHTDPSSVLIFRFGLVYNVCGIYFLIRLFCQSLNDVIRICQITAIILVPLSIMMLLEQATGRNMFSALGGVAELSEIRNGKIRAQGPFAHSILAGTVGAVCLPLMVGLWRQHRKTAIVGTAACLSMVFASASSGPILSALFGIGALFMWHWRFQMRFFRWCALLGYIGLELVMYAPAYYLLARIDLTGSSTGWHRAFLIEAALAHLSEWWLAGTDFTRHWMDYGVGWSGNHVDITNYYLNMGVMGGLPLLLLFIAILVKGFSFVGQSLRQAADFSPDSRFTIWALGASLFSHAATFISVSYFDQSVVFLYLTLAAICSLRYGTALQPSEEVTCGNRPAGSTAVVFPGH